jgi:hypothetical protein
MKTLDANSDLKETILLILADQECTISGLHGKLKEKGIEIHRLVLTGYLRSMRDMEMLVEKEVKPSKLYYINDKVHSDIYSIVGRVSKSIDEERSPEIALSILFSLFGRPVFIREIERCGLPPPRKYSKVMPPERLKYIERLNKAGVSIPSNSVMVEPEEKSSTLSYDVMSRILDEAISIRRYAKENPGSPQQTL